MIPEVYIEQWRKNAPWQTLAMIEQDLVISRALVALYQQPKVRECLAFRGGTALNKLYIQPAVRILILFKLTLNPLAALSLLSEKHSIIGWVNRNAN